MASFASHSCAAFSATVSKHRLNIRRRAGNHTQNLTRRGLLLQRLFELLEQPHVLDRDHRLVGEGFKQLDLRRGEGAHFRCDARVRSPISSPADEGERLKRCGQLPAEPIFGNSFCCMHVGNVERAMLAYPAILRLINTDFGAAERYGTKMRPCEPDCHRRPVAAPRHRSRKPLPRSRRWHPAPAARPWASG